MRVDVGESQRDFEPRPHALSPLDRAHSAPTGLKVGREGGDK
jgi:hypothetical protein